MEKIISNEDSERRESILSDPLMKTLIYISAPLVMHQCLFYLFQMIDASMSARISSEAVSAVFYITQIITVISSIIQGLAIGSGIKIATAYGAGEYDKVHVYVHSTYLLCAAVCGGVLVLCIPFADGILRLARTPEAFIGIGRMYFIISVIASVADAFNAIYQGVERARGNTKLILRLNLRRALIKLALTALLIYAVQTDLTMIAAATLVANLSVSVTAIKNMLKKDGVFGFSLKDVPFSDNKFAEIIGLAVPSGLEKGFFYFGKLVANSIMTFYSEIVVGAFGVAQSMSVFVSGAQLAFQDSSATIINQNNGAGKHKRALDTFKYVLLINTVIGAAGAVIVIIFKEQISMLFASDEPEFMAEVLALNKYVLISLVPMGISNAVTALLYGVGRTKWAMFLNFSRLFILRIPMLYYFIHYTNVGSIAVGLSLALSNIAVAVISLGMAAAIVGRLCHEYKLSFWRAEPRERTL